MGEEEKKAEETKKAEEEKKKEEPVPEAEKPSPAPADGNKKSEEKPKVEKPPPPPPPPQEIVLKVHMHCEGCARKVRRCLKGFEGVEDVKTDCKTSKVTVKGEKADPIKVLERVQRKSHRQVELISPIPAKKEPTKNPEDKVAPKPEEKKEEAPVITVVLGVFMHCEACAQEIKKRIQRMKGVDSADPDLKNSKVTVKGAFESEKLVDYIHRRTGKHATIINVEPEKKEEKPKEEKKSEAPAADKDKDKDAKKADDGSSPASSTVVDGGGGDAEPPAKAEADADAEAEDPTTLDLKKHDFLYYYPHNYHHHIPPQRFVQEEYNYADPYPPQMFSDENPNACSVM